MKRTYSTMTAAELREWLDRMRLTQERGADALGVTRSTLALWLAGRPIPETVAKLARCLASPDTAAT